MTLIADGADPGTFLNPDGDFTADGADAGTFLISGATTTHGGSVWVAGDAEDTPDVDRVWGWVTGYDIPLVPGPMRIDVGVST